MTGQARVQVIRAIAADLAGRRFSDIWVRVCLTRASHACAVFTRNTVDLPNVLFIRVLGCGITLKCQGSDVLDLLRQNYGHMECGDSQAAQIEYSIRASTKESTFRITRKGSNPLVASDDAELLYVIEKDLTVELQKQRRDLYFLHAAALAYSQNAFLLVAPSGGGKSTTTWGLLHYGFSYLSDELSPVNLTTMEIHSYPRAICLKRKPPSAYPIPANTVRTSRTLHIPTREIKVRSQPTMLRCIFFLDFCAEAKWPAVRNLSSGEAAARLFAQALNPLAHIEDGLAGAAALAENVPCFYLYSADLRLTCELIAKTLRLVPDPARRSDVNF